MLAVPPAQWHAGIHPYAPLGKLTPGMAVVWIVVGCALELSLRILAFLATHKCGSGERTARSTRDHLIYHRASAVGERQAAQRRP